MTTPNVPRRSVADTLAGVLASPEVARLIEDLERTRWTGRPGYPIRSMVGMAFAKSMYVVPTWTRTVELVREHTTLAAVIAPGGDVPSVYACYRFCKKLRDHAPLLERCITDTITALKTSTPGLGEHVAIDASDMPAYANGQRFVSKGGRERSDDEFSDPDASWGHRSAVSTRKGGGFYGYRLHLATCAKTDLPLAWRVETARDHETNAVAPLLDKLKDLGLAPTTVALDKGYDNNAVYAMCSERNVAPVIPLRKTPDVVKGKDKPPCCEHGDWRFAGADRKRKATKWRCPTGECGPSSTWVKADRLHPLVPRETSRWKGLYRGRASVERAFGRLKNEWGLAPLRVRRIERVRLHVDLTILAQLAVRLRVQAGDAPLPLAA